jgi:hypothetical protein
MSAYSILDLLSIASLRPLYPTHSVDKEARAFAKLYVSDTSIPWMANG